jgi:hypothetical protein
MRPLRLCRAWWGLVLRWRCIGGRGFAQGRFKRSRIIPDRFTQGRFEQPESALAMDGIERHQLKNCIF